MKGLVFNGPKQVLYQDYPDPVPGQDHEVILKVEKASICGSDLHIYHGGNIGSIQYDADSPPFCIGHEFIGQVVEKGRAVKSVSQGDRVIAAASTRVACGKCEYCLDGQAALCTKIRETCYGLRPELNGGQAQYVRIPLADMNLAKIPEGMSDENAIILTDQLPTAYMGAKKANIRPGDTVAVIGLGSVGLMAVQSAFLLGAAKVLAMDLVKERCDAAQKLGATIVGPQELKPSAGIHSVIEAVGSEKTVALATRLVGFGGTVSVVGVAPASASLDIGLLVYKNITLTMNVCSVQKQWKALLPLVSAGRIDGSCVFTHELDLSQGEEAYRMFDTREDGCIKVMLNCS